ncbi:myb-like protein D [Teleopsis dalmanni]|uniref:myb-like protein D n=1 Tax=Teleopsis dalmanni TaxID=139649 RepID=UPI0018CCB26A|nr:myb-like protein D [Teleopsis dalmanni]
MHHALLHEYNGNDEETNHSDIQEKTTEVIQDTRALHLPAVLIGTALIERKYNITSPQDEGILISNDEHALLAYKKGLNATYSQTVQAAQPKSFQEARDFAENLVFPDQRQQVLYTQHYRGNINQFNNYQNNNSSRNQYQGIQRNNNQRYQRNNGQRNENYQHNQRNTYNRNMNQRHRNYNITSPQAEGILISNDEHALLAYKKGLNATYSQTVQAAQPKSFQEARDFAENLVFPDQRQQQRNQFNNYQNNNSSRNQYQGIQRNNNQRYQRNNGQRNENYQHNQRNTYNRNMNQRHVRLTSSQENYMRPEENQ